MKKISTLFLIGLLCLSLAACDPSWSNYEEEALHTDVIRVELIDYRQPRAKVINSFFFSERLFLRFDLREMDVLETLDDADRPAFFEDFSSLGLWTHWIHLNSPDGVCIRLVYADGSFDVLSAKEIGDETHSIVMKYDETGKVLDYIGPMTDTDEFFEIIEKYFDSE